MDQCRGDTCHAVLHRAGHWAATTLLARGAHSTPPRPAIVQGLPHTPDHTGLVVNIFVAVILVLLGGTFAGLTIALMGQDETHLEVIATSGESLSERRNASRVLSLLRMGKHWVLVSLLLGNVITNETLPIVLDSSLGSGWSAVLSSTVAIVIFGEIAPQSICVRWGLAIGAFMTPFVKILMWVLSPVAWPIAKLLDRVLGEDRRTIYKKAGLKRLVQLHQSLGKRKERLIDDEVTIINAALDLKEKTVFDVMTPIENVFTLGADTMLDEKALANILSQGYSRIPIHAPGNDRNFQGMLLVKNLIGYDPHPETRQRIQDRRLAPLPETSPSTSCLDMINFFQQGKSHMVLVSHYPGQDRGALGVVTLEDVLEELIGEEIIDESDIFVDVHRAIRRNTSTLPRNPYTRPFTDAISPTATALPHEPGVEMGLLRTSSDGVSTFQRVGSLTENVYFLGNKEKIVLVQNTVLEDDEDDDSENDSHYRLHPHYGEDYEASYRRAHSASPIELEDVVIDR